jgi:transmembrane sensor
VKLHVGDVDAGAYGRLDAWFRESPQHIRAFLELSSIWEDGGDPDLDRSNSTDSLIARARAVPNVIPLEKEERNARALADDSARGRRPRSARVALTRLFSWRSVVAASAVVAVLTAALYVLHDSLNPTYTTATGEERSIRLEDGSSLVLNSRSRIRVRFSEHERNVDLLEGQALFHVAKDLARPFIVRSDSARVRAVGTQFDVYRKTYGTTVTVVEGQVAVLPVERGFPGATIRPSAPDAFNVAADVIVLAAGQQVTITPSAAGPTVHADVATATSWVQRQIVFDSTPLTDVAQEFNRYNVRQLIVSDDTLKDFHVTGVFSSTDPASLLRFLRAQRGISVEETDKGIRISKR